MSTLKQLFSNANLAQTLVNGGGMDLDRTLSRRLNRVMRMKQGQKIALFNAKDGIFEAEITSPDCTTIKIQKQLKPFAPVPDSTLLIGLLKRDAMNSVLRQATEMGIARIQPVITEFCQADKLNMERANAILVEAAEQCERCDLPTIVPPLKLSLVLTSFKEKEIFWACERAGSCWPSSAKFSDGDALLIGPEGGFSTDEKSMLSKQKNVTPIGLGSHILRADTAVVAGLSRMFNMSGC